MQKRSADLLNAFTIKQPVKNGRKTPRLQQNVRCDCAYLPKEKCVLSVWASNFGGYLKAPMNTCIFGPWVGFDSVSTTVVPFSLVFWVMIMFNPFHTIGVIMVSTLFSAAVSWTDGVFFNHNTPQQTNAALAQSSAPKFSLPPTTVVVVYYPTSDNPSYTVVVNSSVGGSQTYYVAARPKLLLKNKPIGETP